MQDDFPRYTDTPVLPASTYRVHDPERPQPPAVDPGEPTTQPPPADATALFDGGDLDAWETVDGGPAAWTVEEGEYFEVASGAGDVRTREPIGDCQLHVEWRTPAPPADSWDRGNSGVFLMDRYEIQVFDNYENAIYADGRAGAVYGQHPPLVDACREPGAWQSFDLVWRGPRFDDDGELTRPAVVTVLHNGVVVQDGSEVYGPTAHQQSRPYEPHAPAAPLRLQDHGDPVRFRNVWYRPLRA
jgi:hypothetical protein